MTATDQIRTVIRDLEAKAKEMELDKKLATFADQADHYLRAAATKAGDYAAENRERVEASLDRAGTKVDEKTDGKYHSSISKVRAGVLTGVDWVAEQRDPADTKPGDATPGDATPGDATPGDATASDAAASGPAEGSADSEAWVDVTDAPPAPSDPLTESPTDPK